VTTDDLIIALIAFCILGMAVAAAVMFVGVAL
jgi:hypothetical protein